MNHLDFLKAISEPLRLRIISLLRQSPLSGTDLVSILEVSQSNISHHLSILVHNNILEAHKRKNQKIFTLMAQPVEAGLSKDIWEKLNDLLGEIPETTADRFRLQELLQQKTELSNRDWETWRLQQPDLPHTEEFLRLGLPKGSVALDIGCGNGEFSKSLAHSYHTVIGMDAISWHENWLKVNSSVSNTLFLEASGEKLPFLNGSMGTIYFRMSLSFFEDPKQGLREASRCLKNNGKIVIIEKSNNIKSITIDKTWPGDISLETEVHHPHVSMIVFQKS